jgi:hypothetical protein
MQLLDEQPDATEGDLHELLRPFCATTSSLRCWPASRR